MPINKIFFDKSPVMFFGLKNREDFLEFGITHLTQLKDALQKKLDFANLGIVDADNIASLRSDSGRNLQNLLEFREKQLATLTLDSPEFHYKNSSDDEVNTHTIGLVLNKNQYEYYYKCPEQIIIMDSLGNNYPGAKKIHQLLINNFLRKEFPNSNIVITSKC